MVWVFNILLLILDWSSKQKINKTVEDLKLFKKKIDLIDIYRTCHPVTEYAVFKWSS